MRRRSAWLVPVLIVLGALILRAPLLQRVDDTFLTWFMRQSQPLLAPVPVTLVEISPAEFEKIPKPAPGTEQPPGATKGQPFRSAISPLDYALFLQAVMEFQPSVVALEPIVIWRDGDKDQAQIFIDQAMRVPKLLVGIELGDKGPHDLSPDEVPSFPRMSGERGKLTKFAGVSRQPEDDIRLISTPGFTNLGQGRNDWLRVPMLFDYRGAIVPSFPLQAIMLWLRVTPAEVKIDLGAQIDLPNGWKIPIRRDGTITINPVAERSVRRLSLNQLLLAAQEHETQRPPTVDLESLKGQIVLLRISDGPEETPDVFAAAIATIQNNAYVRPAPWIFGWLIIFLAALLGWFSGQISKTNLVLWAIAGSAGYCLLALSVLSKGGIWLPTFLPLCLLWFLVVVRLFVSAVATKRRSS